MNAAKKTTKRSTKSKPRFVLEKPTRNDGTSKLRGWRPPWGDDIFANDNYMTEFLGRLWALFGEPNEKAFEGFGYVLRDRESGIVITAYSAGTGPSFGAHRGDVGDAVDALELAINEAKPVDCSWQMFDDNTGVDIKLGIKKGRHYFETDGAADE